LIGQSRARKTSHVFDGSQNPVGFKNLLDTLKADGIEASPNLIVYVSCRRRRLTDLWSSRTCRQVELVFLANAHLRVVTKSLNSQKRLDIVEVKLQNDHDVPTRICLCCIGGSRS
jgi:hypothetical protein